MPNSADDIKPSIGIILLAAGASRRMGQPKQLLKIGSQTVLEKAINLTQALKKQHTVVVLGANANRMQQLIKKRATLATIFNKNWHLGMGTTLSAGMNYFLQKEIDVEAVIVMVCDQPYLTTEKLESLIDAFQNSSANIIATTYNDILGVPALFSKNLFL